VICITIRCYFFGPFNDDNNDAMSVESNNRKINTCLIERYRAESECGLISVHVSRNLPSGTKHHNPKETVDISTEIQPERLEFVRHKRYSFINVA
jgi:hypothetical protein